MVNLLLFKPFSKKGNLWLKFLWRQAKFLNQYSKRLLASSIILCHFVYACFAWHGSLQKLYQQKLQILQNKTIRFVLDCPSRSHVEIAKFKELNWIPFSKRAKQINLCKVYSVVHGSAPKYLKMYFFKVSERHSISTRHTCSVHSLVLPHVKSSGASQMCNALPAHLKSAPNGTLSIIYFMKSMLIF